MLESIIKRDGHTEPFTPSKLNQWGEGAAQSLGDSVDWPSAVLETVSSMSTTATSRELQQQLFQSSDAKEGIAAYVEKRTAKFEGK